MPKALMKGSLWRMWCTTCAQSLRAGYNAPRKDQFVIEPGLLYTDQSFVRVWDDFFKCGCNYRGFADRPEWVFQAVRVVRKSPQTERRVRI